jgi:hypothetical protein
MVGTDIQDVLRGLDAIDAKLTQLAKRITGIEKALGIKQPPPSPPQDPAPDPARSPAD